MFLLNKHTPSSFWQPTPKYWWNRPPKQGKNLWKWAKMDEKHLSFLWALWTHLGICLCTGSVYSALYGIASTAEWGGFLNWEAQGNNIDMECNDHCQNELRWLGQAIGIMLMVFWSSDCLVSPTTDTDTSPLRRSCCHYHHDRNLLLIPWRAPSVNILRFHFTIYRAWSLVTDCSSGPVIDCQGPIICPLCQLFLWNIGSWIRC